MLVLVSGASATLDRYADRPWLGSFVQPRNGIAPGVLEQRWHERGWPWACDNDAFNESFDHGRFVRMVNRLVGRPGLLWIAVPDVVGDCSGTAHLFLEHWHQLHCWERDGQEHETPLAWVAQDGAEDHHLTEDCLGVADCVFLGGSTVWKESRAAASIAAEAKDRGRLVHMGRVNTKRRLRIAFEMECDSVDGTGASMFPEVTLANFDRWLGTLTRQPALF
ncbi:hypothetical protein AB1L88_15605 [Tautonia sp. JC769]|uniref:hypothetical protein n=1 Tax=Tautonia sp. JC769 TaxID=3232135 RepID=UPI00345B4734